MSRPWITTTTRRTLGYFRSPTTAIHLGNPNLCAHFTRTQHIDCIKYPQPPTSTWTYNPEQTCSNITSTPHPPTPAHPQGRERDTSFRDALSERQKYMGLEIPKTMFRETLVRETSRHRAGVLDEHDSKLSTLSGVAAQARQSTYIGWNSVHPM